jgi:DMSO reductase family type II enzyme chaperone
MGESELISGERLRGDCYRLLAACFYYPQNEIFIQENLFNNLTEALKSVCPPAAVFSEGMAESISGYTDEDLLIDYAKLFVGPNELVAPPYGSVYIDGEGKVLGDSTIETIKMYQDEGLSIDDEFRELPDHITVELEFMSYLIFKETEAIEQSDFKRAKGFIDKQEIFLNNFLCLWVPQFCERISKGTENGFYRALADCLSSFILKSNRGLSELLTATNIA